MYSVFIGISCNRLAREPQRRGARVVRCVCLVHPAVLIRISPCNSPASHRQLLQKQACHLLFLERRGGFPDVCLLGLVRLAASHHGTQQSICTGSIAALSRHQQRTATAAAAVPDWLPAAPAAAVRLWPAAATSTRWLSRTAFVRLQQSDADGTAVAHVLPADRLWAYSEHRLPALVAVRAVSQDAGNRSQLRCADVGCVICFPAWSFFLHGSVTAAAATAFVLESCSGRSGSFLGSATTADAAAADAGRVISATVPDNATATGDETAGAVWRPSAFIHEEQQDVSRIMEYGCLGPRQVASEPA